MEDYVNRIEDEYNRHKNFEHYNIEKREHMASNPVLVKERNYTAFPRPEIFEKFGYRVENIDDWDNLQVYDAYTGERLVLSNVDYSLLEFMSRDGRFFKLRRDGLVLFYLDKFTYLQATDKVYRDGEHQVEYKAVVLDSNMFSHAHELVFEQKYNENNYNPRNLGTMKLSFGSKKENEIYFERSAKYTSIVDGPGGVFGEKGQYELSNEESTKENYLKIINYLMQKIKLDTSESLFRYSVHNAVDCMKYCIDKYVGDFANIYSIDKAIASYMALKESKKQEYQRRLDEELSEIDDKINELLDANERRHGR